MSGYTEIALLQYELAKLHTRVAALELEVVRLREALEIASGFIRRTNDEYGVDSDESEIEQCVQSTLSTPFTPATLPELIEKVEKMTIERCAEKLLSIGPTEEGWIDDFDYDAGMMMGHINAAAAIRKLGEQ